MCSITCQLYNYIEKVGGAKLKSWSSTHGKSVEIDFTSLILD